MDCLQDLIGKTLYTPTQKSMGVITAVNSTKGACRTLVIQKQVRVPRTATLEPCRDGVRIQRSTPKKQAPAQIAPSIEIAFLDGREEDVQPKQETVTFPSAPTLSIPSRILANYTFLLGRTTTDDIPLGEDVLKKGTLITASAVERAHTHGKLFELTVKSKTQQA